MSSAGPLDELWAALVTASLLGTDRRDPPAPPAGPLGDLVADAVAATPSERMLDTVAAVVAARRAGFVPGAPADRLAPPEPDHRPMCPLAAVRTYDEVVSDWSVLEDEWVLAVVRGGWRLPPDVLVAALRRHRGDPVRRARVARAAGPLAPWLVDHVPALASRSAGTTVPATAVDDLPDLPVPPEWAELLHADAHTFARRLVPAFAAGRIGAPHRAVLVNLLARCRPEVLEHAAAALRGVDALSPSATLAHSLAELAALRARMLAELAPPRGQRAVASAAASGR